MHPASGPVRLSDPLPEWLEILRRERLRLALALGEVFVEVHHIGSTAIPNIRAKPIVDLVPVVSSLAQLDGARASLEALGYDWWGEFGIAGRRFCTLHDPVTGRRSVNAHFFAQHDPEIERHVAFRDYLRAHPEAAREYEAVKARAAALHPQNVADYNDEKSPWIRAVEPVAIAYFHERQSAHER
jgi:GrpB-like predicted nucleotidyltransferase (UPF0157 family)